MHWRVRFLFVVAGVLAACAPVNPETRDPTGAGGQSQASPSTRGGAPRTVMIGMDEDIKNLWESVTLGGGSGARELTNIYNQHLVAITADGSPTPRLLSELPSVEKGTWRVLPDGTMETTYKLRPNVVWHDGTPFTGGDLAFSLQVNRDPNIPNSNRDAMRLVDRWEVTDPGTVVVTWTQTYPFADRMEHRDLYPLPRHLLEATYAQGTPEMFLAAPYFNVDYVGLGPFKVQGWEVGSYVEFTAFDRYFLGRPRLDAIRVMFIPDNNTMLANLNAKAIQSMLTLGGIPPVDAMLAVKRGWEASGYGTVLMDPISYRFVEPQKYHSPQPQDLTNPKVRQALLFAIDRPGLANVVFGEFGIVADSWVHPSFGTYAALQDAITKYPYDLRRARALMEEAGWRPGTDGVLEKGGQKFSLTARDTTGESEFLIVAANWKELGVSATFELRTAAALRDRQDRATFSGVDLTSNPMGVAAVVRRTASYNIPKEENRWTGTNRGGYVNPTWDELEQRMLAGLDEHARIDIEKELLRIYTTDLPLLPLYFRNDMVPVGGGLKGPVANTGVAHRGFILHTWNVHEWEIGQ
jgi:peptide/nickel transport system substrate-binding protein